MYVRQDPVLVGDYVREQLAKRGFELVEHGFCWRRGNAELSAEALDELEEGHGRVVVDMAMRCLDRGALGFNTEVSITDDAQLRVTIVPHGILDKLAQAADQQS